MAASKKEPKVLEGFSSSGREPRVRINPDRFRAQSPVWQVGLIDIDGRWGFGQVEQSVWWKEIYPKLRDFESMTWQAILDASGGRERGNNSHEIPVCELVAEARRRLKYDLKITDVDVLFSLRLTGKLRIWGILTERILKIIWFDPNHEIYDSKRK